MGHEFAQHHSAEVPARPDQVWAAIATGPGIDSWFMGRNEVKAGAGGTVHTVFGEYAPELEITGWIRVTGSPTAAVRRRTGGSSPTSS
jgi:hypothetical protein